MKKKDCIAKTVVTSSAEETFRAVMCSGPKGYRVFYIGIFEYPQGTGSPLLTRCSNIRVLYITRSILVLSSVHLVLNHSSAYIVFCLPVVSPKLLGWI